MSDGLLIGGGLHPTPGVVVIPPANHGGPAWNELGPDDYAMRPSLYVQQIIVHTTGGKWPQPIIAGKGPPGHAKEVAADWRGTNKGGGERVHSGAHILIDFDGTIYCLVDLMRCAAYHAELSNSRSVGIEMCTTPNGSIYGATLDSCAVLVALLAWSGLEGSGLLPIPFQMPRGPYRNMPLRRMETGAGKTRHQLGGVDCVGVFGHRDNTSERGFGDPGDEIWRHLAALGAEGLDYNGTEDLIVGKARQVTLNRQGAALTEDGMVGPASISAARRLGYRRWRDVPQHDAA